MRLLLEADALKLVEPRTKDTLLVQPVSKMRVWGVGKEDQRYNLFKLFIVLSMWSLKQTHFSNPAL